MVTKNIKVEITTASDAMPTAMLVQIASRFESSIRVTCGKNTFNAKSIMGMITLGLHTGDELIVSAEGVDESEAMESISRYLSNK